MSSDVLHAMAVRCLRHEMAETSEDEFAASWMIDTEYRLWTRGGKWHEMAQAVDGWWTYERFVPLKEWEAIYAEYAVAHPKEIAHWVQLNDGEVGA